MRSGAVQCGVECSEAKKPILKEATDSFGAPVSGHEVPELPSSGLATFLLEMRLHLSFKLGPKNK